MMSETDFVIDSEALSGGKRAVRNSIAEC
jgi:hypothetical protein